MNLIPGADVYPNPGLIILTFWTDFAFGFTLSVQTTIPPIIIAVAIPVFPFAGAEPIPTMGVFVYPPPRFVTVMNWIPPLRSIVLAVAVLPTPTIVSVCTGPTARYPSSRLDPTPVKTSSISSTPVSIISSS